MSHYIALAINQHDSCITVANDKEILLHLELERFLRVKHYRVRDINVLFSLIALICRDYHIDEISTFIVSKHKVNKLDQQIVEYIHENYANADIFEVEHMDAHAALCYLSGLDDALVVSVDGGGDRSIGLDRPNFSAYLYKDTVLKPLSLSNLPSFDGRIWTLISKKIFGDRFGAGKTMGLAAYGTFRDEYRDVLLSDKFKHLGDIWSCHNSTNLLSSLKVETFNDKASLAATLQQLYSYDLVDTIKSYRNYSDNLVITGGCALNITTNRLISERLGFLNIYIPPCPGDEGQSLGAMLYYLNHKGVKIENVSFMPYLGQGEKNSFLTESDYAKLTSLLIREKTLAWHMGRSEVGPRGLGHRSLLAMPGKVSTKEYVSEVIKKREPFRPLAPVVLEEYAAEWFSVKNPSPYMSFSVEAKEITRRLAPAIVHKDGSSRIQTLSKKQNQELHQLISRVYEITGIPMLINTSLNVSGMPICNSSQDSKHLFTTTPVDALCLNGSVYLKSSASP